MYDIDSFGSSSEFPSFNVFFTGFIILFIISIITVIIKTIITAKKNSGLPRLTVDALLVSKNRTYKQTSTPVGGDSSGANGYHTQGSYTYYVTFQVESGDHIRFRITKDVYDSLFDGDTGRLSLQGNRFLGFEPCKIDTTRFRYSNTYQ